MADQFLGEIRMFTGNFAPVNWATCDGQIMAISQNTALFSLLGTNYGGDGRVTFGLPDLRGRAPINAGQGPGLSMRSFGEEGGAETVTLDMTTMPAHNHSALGFLGDGNSQTPIGNTWAEVGSGRTGKDLFTDNTSSLVPVGKPTDQIMSYIGGNQSHENRQPFLVVTFIIALGGIFPSRG